MSHLQKLGADFKLGRVCAPLLSLHSPSLNALEELTHGTWDDPLLVLAHSHIEARAHGVRLPRTSLTTSIIIHINVRNMDTE